MELSNFTSAGTGSVPGVPGVPGAHHVQGSGSSHTSQDYDRFVADVWVCVALTLMILSCVGLLCSCMLYHKLQQWKLHAERVGSGGEEARRDSLPSYTLVTGLPTYEQALEMNKSEETKYSKPSSLESQSSPSQHSKKLDVP